MQADISVNRYAEMSVEELAGESERIQARRAAAKAQDGDDWRGAEAHRPGPAGVDIDPAAQSVEKTPEPDNPQSGSQKRKSEIGGFTADDDGSTQNLSPTRAQVSGAPVEDDGEVFVVPTPSSPGHSGEADLTRDASPLPDDDDDDVVLP